MVVYLIIYKVLYIPGGCLGFLPSTVVGLEGNSEGFLLNSIYIVGVGNIMTPVIFVGVFSYFVAHVSDIGSVPKLWLFVMAFVT